MRYDAGEVITAMVTPFNEKREVDYEKVDVEELISIDPNNESFFHDGKVYLSTLLDLYENVGVVCDE